MLPAAPSVIRPAFLWVPPSAVGSLGDEAAELAVSLDQDVREEERIALRALMPIKANGMPAGLESGIITGRQQVKSWAMEIALIHDGWVTKVGRCMWSAHQTKTSDDSFAHLVSLVESFDWLRKRVRNIYSGNGNHKIVFNDKQRTYPTLGAAGRQMVDRTIEFGARETGKTGRGRTKINRLTFDEWLMGTKTMKGAQVPMMGAAGDRYIRYGSSSGLLTSTDLRVLRERGRIGTLDPAMGDPSLSWVEWTSERVRLVTDPRTGRPRMERVLPTCADPECSHIAGQVDGCYLDDMEVIRSACPAFGTLRLPEDFVIDERRALDSGEYARERAGVWEDPPEGAAADDILADWPNRETTSAPTGPLALALDVSYDLRGAALAVCGAGVVEVVDYRRHEGTGWIADRVTELMTEHNIPADSFGLVGGSPAASLLPKLPAETRVLTSTEATAACSSFAQDLPGHHGQPALDIAVGAAVRALSGDGWRWSRKASKTDISPLWAAVVACRLAGVDVPHTEYQLLNSFG